MPDFDFLNQLVGLTAVATVALLTVPTLVHSWKTSRHFRGGYIQFGGDEGTYEDRDGIATEDSIRAYTDTRPRVTAWLCTIIGLGASIAARISLLKGAHDTNVINELVAWTEPACWVFLCLQCAVLPSKHQHRGKFPLTIFGLLSSLLVGVSVALRHGYEALTSLHGPERDTTATALGGLYLLQFVSAMTATCGFAAFPRRPDVYDNARLVDQQHTLSLLSRFTFTWNRGIFNITEERQMKVQDIPNLDFATRSRNLQAKFLGRHAKGPLWKQLIKAHAGELALQWTLTLFIALLALFPQVVLYNFLSRIERSQQRKSSDPTVFIWVFGLLLSQVLQVGVNNWLKWITASRLEIPVNALLQSLVFSKALKQYETAPPGQDADKSSNPASQDGPNDTVRETSREQNGSAKGKKPKTRQSVINHMKLDSGRVTIFCSYNNNFPMAIFKLILAGGFAVSLMGWMPVVCGLAAGSLMVPISSMLSRRYTKLHFGLMKFRDGKAHLLTEALQGMRQIRYSALEQHWETKILASRNEELRQYWKVALWQCLVVFCVNLGPLLLASVTFSIYVWQNGTHIRASIIFTSLGLFDQLDEAVSLLPLLQMYLLEAWTSAVRLEKYFNQSDKEPVAEPADAIAFDNATVAWPRIQDTDKSEGDGEQERREFHSMLRDATLDFPIGKLSVITGKTGSGKSLLLAALLGEVKILAGSVRMPRLPEFDDNPKYIPKPEWIIPQLTAFVSQTPWIEGGTVKENILFGLPFVEDRYRKVIEACALEKDIELLVDSDETEVGPKGVTLSGGQRWRVALARALYSRAGILVLDDVLSAVDAHVGRLIVDRALTGELARGRTRILATHHAELVMPYASYLVCLRSGEVESAELLPQIGAKAVMVEEAEQDTSSGPPAKSAADTRDGPSAPVTSNKATKDEERRESGHVKWRVYKAYFKASGGVIAWLVGISILLVTHALTVARAWSLKELSQQAASETAHFASQTARIINSLAYTDGFVSHKASGSEHGVFFWLTAYVVIEFVMLLVQVTRVLTIFFIGLRASTELFQRMTRAILRAPLRWIDTVPAGRILNRFTTDTFAVDRRLSSQTFSFLRNLIFLVVIISSSLSVSVYVIFFGVFLFVLYMRVAREYIRAAREVKRINSVSHSPIYDQFSSVLSGLSTIRAFDRTRFYMNRMYGLIDNSSKASWMLELSSRWMAFRMGVLGALFVSVVANAVAFSRVDAALAGFSLAFALRYTSALTSLLQSMTSVELGFNACERVLEYAEIETEPDGGKDAPAAWPTEGRIEVGNLTVRYAADLPPVLKSLNFNVGAGERIGIIGRTGAGKSTLAAVFFRLLEPVEGFVRIDDVDISTLKLSQLRSRLAIIPQDPFLFSGTLRSNLDIEGTMDDCELLESLKRVHLIETVEDFEPPVVPFYTDDATASTSASAVLPIMDSETATQASTEAERGPQLAQDSSNIFTNLSTPVSTGGANLSQGQRQLVCLARALLKRPKIVVLDEATSAVDRGTDSNIQESLRKEFAANGCTVLVIAHRLSTVADFDQLLVLEKGRVAEMGTPRELLLAGLTRAAADAQRVARNNNANEDSPERDGHESTLQSETGAEVDGTGAFWELVQKSAERDKLLEMILGEEKDMLMEAISGKDEKRKGTSQVA
ncbi:P-loop containing nucleoside triphosphate hydrolase protein [Parathielavia appendiculata]|uniref:P-loop containing nucleoside triphosphate hydrolase protein n=1 Tax=Parathielavia appendiculata TaxID=2587402 RepID=A0AAN6Z8J3_9PEZI|nr:P-loop containing nucleoside triphosphate hydrolase protein [Parathielavia appendiculata]